MANEKKKSIFRLAINLFSALPLIFKVGHSFIELIELEASLTKKNIISLAIISLLFLFILGFAWLCLLGILLTYLLSLQFSLMAGLIILFSIHLILLIIIGFVFTRTKKELFFPKTRRALLRLKN